MSQGPFLRKYGVQTTVNFQLFKVDGVDFRVDAVHATADTKIMKDEGAEANTTNGFVDEGQGYSIILSATEMQAARIVVYVVDGTATKVWLDTAIVIETYGNASAMHAMDFDDAVRGGMTALPNAAADAAGGLAISDAGGLDLDAKLANTNEVTVARMGALTDWINGGRLDLLLDAIPTTAMRGTDNANTTTPPTAAAVADQVWDEAQADHVTAGSFGITASEIAALQTDLDNGTDGLGALKTLIDAIKTVVDAVLVDTGTTLQAEVDAIQAAVITNAAGVDVAADIIALKAETALIVADTNELQTDDVPGLIAALNDISAANVNTEVVDALTVDTIAELSQAAPSATPTIATAIMLMYMALRNKVTVTATEQGIHNDAGTKIVKSTLSDDGTTFTNAEMGSGA